ncbi:hypothetical protein U1Q18_033238 [Sarracenia purpurea var. burkii]
MASVCKTSCINDARVPLPVRATYINLYKWPESDAEFVRSVSSNGRRVGRHPTVVDSISCRQLYLRSYTFSRKESVPEKTRKCLGRVKERMVLRTKNGKPPRRGGGGARKCGKVIKGAKEMSCAALSSIFRRLLSCTTQVDVVG